MNLLPSHANPASTVSVEDMDRHFEKHRIMHFVETRSPDGDERTDWDVPGWHTFYVKIFDCGFCHPVMGLLLSFCKHYSIHPSQLSPGSIRTIVGVDRLKERYGFNFTVEDFSELYFLKRSAVENGRFILNLKPGRTPLIPSSKTNEGKWKDSIISPEVFYASRNPPSIPHPGTLLVV